MPSVGAFDLPTPGLAVWVAGGIFGPPAFGGNMRSIAFQQHDRLSRGIVKRGIQTQMVRVPPSGLRPDDGEGSQYERQHGAVIDIGGRAHEAQRDAPPIDQQMVFIAGFGAVGRIRAGLFFPPPGRARSSRRLTATPSRCPACRRRGGDNAPRSVQRSRRASTRQSGRRRFARDQTRYGTALATAPRSRGRGACHPAACDHWPASGRLWHVRAAQVKVVQFLPRDHQARDVVLA